MCQSLPGQRLWQRKSGPPDGRPEQVLLPSQQEPQPQLEPQFAALAPSPDQSSQEIGRETEDLDQSDYSQSGLAYASAKEQGFGS